MSAFKSSFETQPLSAGGGKTNMLVTAYTTYTNYTLSHSFQVIVVTHLKQAFVLILIPLTFQPK